MMTTLIWVLLLLVVCSLLCYATRDWQRGDSFRLVFMLMLGVDGVLHRVFGLVPWECGP